MKIINIFLGGGVDALYSKEEPLRGYRSDVMDHVIIQLQSSKNATHHFKVNDYKTLIEHHGKESDQEIINRYIVQEAHFAIFILDGAMGPITEKEIDLAIDSYIKKGYPFVQIFSRGIEKNEKILNYLNGKGKYSKAFVDDNDLVYQIKDIIQNSLKEIDKRKTVKFWTTLLFVLFLTASVFSFIHYNLVKDENVVDSCSAQLYLMRYKDVNVLTDVNMFNDSLLDKFKYEDSIVAENDRAVYPIYVDDSCVVSTQPYFRLKLHNKHRNTVVFVEAVLEVDQYSKDTLANQVVQFSHSYTDVSAVDNIAINPDANEYLLGGFRQNVAYGETDDRYFFTLNANENCSFRMRVKAKTHLGDYLYSNYVYVNYIK